MKKYFAGIVCFLLLFELSECVEDFTSNGEKDSISIAISQDIIGFYPWEKSYEIYTVLVNRNIYNSLVEFDEIFGINSCLAKSWNNPDDYTWKFFLRENVTFHNGYAFTSEDVKYTIDLIRENESEDNQLRELLKLVEEVKIIDKYTIEIRTIKPCSNLLNLLTDIFIVSKQYQEETQIQQPIGTGAYRLINYSKNEYIELQRYDGYWKKDLPEIKHATFKIIRGYENNTKALLDYEVDIAQISQKYLDTDYAVNYSIETIANPSVVYISFDFRDTNNITGYNEKNPFADLRVRKAIYHAINISEMLNNSTVRSPSSQFVIPLAFGYNPEIQRPTYNITAARQLMNDSGYKNGFTVVFDYSFDVFEKDTIEFIKNQLSEININLTVNSLSYEEYMLKLLTHNVTFYINAWTTGTGDSVEIYDYLIGTHDEEKDIGSFNAGLYSNSTVDRLGENASISMEPFRRLILLQECFKIAMNDVAWIPLFTWKSSYGINNQFIWTPRADQQILIEYIKISK
jgi:peptide/nickel transport system substrate-binding protein